MEVHRMRCQSCGSLDLRNLLRHDEQHELTIYTRCARCHTLVARLEIAEYYHHGKGFESWLRRNVGARESGRLVMSGFRDAKAEAEREYAEVLAEAARQGKDVDEQT